MGKKGKVEEQMQNWGVQTNKKSCRKKTTSNKNLKINDSLN